MSEIYSIQTIHDSLKKRIEDYIETEYLGKNKALRNACHEALISNGVLYKDLMVEANCGYELSEKKIYETDLPDDIKRIMKKYVETKIGFFEYPYKHQVVALENFYKGNDLLVSTGTGSGKTECFLWPMVSKLTQEAKNSTSWNKRGVRAVILYPMNALVSDQESRLRKMIGDYDDKFLSSFNELTNGARRPQFGMYTGRTKYSGDRQTKKDKELADTLDTAYINHNPADSENLKTIEKLKDLGKYPAKKSLEQFIEFLRKGKHYTDPLDAELLTRFEMRQTCPDILITNYSMLEYMMVREEEKIIWDETANWLESSKDNKLLFIIDEAHMYKGSSGAEVALLIKRFMANLNIGRDKIQFILTSASFPTDSLNDIYQFACDLTNESFDKHHFKFIIGEPKSFDSFNLPQLSLPSSFDFNIYDLYDNEKKYKLIEECFLKLGIRLIGYHPTNDIELGNYLYEFLPSIGQVVSLIEFTRGKAKSISAISKKIFSDEDSEVSNKVVEFLLALLPLAKNEKNQVLFPTRIHMMFRGITGIYACSNPKCKYKNHSLSFGKVFINMKKDRCECGAKVYEVLNERSCGALFFKSFKDKKDPTFLWNSQIFNNNLRETPVYIPEDIEEMQALSFKKNDSNFYYLNPFTGKLNVGENEDYLPIYLMKKDKKEETDYNTFVCPKCEKRNSIATDFATKGNEPFYNLIAEQFNLQPQTITDKEILKVSPNGGRKVLVFSDSRSKAAKLALDLTRAADRDAFRKILVIAAKKLKESSEGLDYKPTMDLLYPAFLHVVIEKKVKLFYGSDKEKLGDLIEQITQCLPDYTDGNLVNYKDLLDECSGSILNVYNEEMLYHICSNFNSLTDLRMCYIQPNSFVIRKFKQTGIYSSGKITEDDFIKIYAAWVDHIMTDSLAYDKTIPYEVRKNVRPGVQRYGDDSTSFNKKYSALLASKFTKDEQQELFNAIGQGLESGGENKYLQLSKNILIFDDKKTWYHCPKCGCIFPFEFDGACMLCGNKHVDEVSNEDLKGIEFYTKPVYDELKKPDNARILTINTMEHTAQINSADESDDKVWTKAENYEMRFQDLILNKEEPIDVLSCTTTMEVGVDIGALTAIGLRDVPPLVENYQQRVGRAGRRGTSISTILTYVENGPHDNYYFNNPQEIISGPLRRPWIDVNNPKLIGRHFTLTNLNKFLFINQKSLYHMNIRDFCNQLLESSLGYIKSALEDDAKCKILIPEHANFDKKEYYEKLEKNLRELAEKIKTFPEQYKNEHDQPLSTLDVLIKEGIFPNYSFPRDVVSFYIQDPKNPKDIMHAPSRSIDLALSEYAPGKLIVVNKNTYRCGGLYAKGFNIINATESYLASNEYLKNIYCCTNKFCNWMDENRPNNDICPFCGSETKKQQLLKPWGFSPIRGKPDVDSAKNDSYSTSSTPVYAIVSDDSKMMNINNYANIRVENKYNQKISIVNKGVGSAGFRVCKKCGGAILKVVDSTKKIEMPFISKEFRCGHNNTIDVYLGTTDIVTDMALFQVKLNPSQIECSYNGYWLRKAATTLVQAIILGASKLLDIDYNELKGGYRVRTVQDKRILELFIFDSLTSGAGYSAMVSKRASEILDIAYSIMDGCSCDSSCHNCLENFYNQNEANNLDRFRGLELLRYIKNGTVSPLLTSQKQFEYAQILNKLFAGQNDDYYIDNKMNFHMKDKVKKVIIYPCMLSKNMFNDETINIPDFYVENAIALAYAELIK